MRFALLFSFLGIVTVVSVQAFSVLAADVPKAAQPVVLELFTSQSCSSCPPADALLESLAQDPNVIAIGCHVTYWDHLSWRDTLSLSACTERQRNYNVFLDRGVFTPQLVVNGTQSLVGSNARGIADALRITVPIAGAVVKFDGMHVDAVLPSVGAGEYFVTVFGKGAMRTQDIRSGENAGERIVYAEPVSEILTLGPWDGVTKTFSAAFETRAEKAVVLVQDAKTARVVAAGQADASR